MILAIGIAVYILIALGVWRTLIFKFAVDPNYRMTSGYDASQTQRQKVMAARQAGTVMDNREFNPVVVFGSLLCGACWLPLILYKLFLVPLHQSWPFKSANEREWEALNQAQAHNQRLIDTGMDK